MKMSSKKLLTILICTALFITDISSARFYVSASELEQQSNPVAENDGEKEDSLQEKSASEGESGIEGTYLSEETVIMDDEETIETETATGQEETESETGKNNTEIQETETEQGSSKETETQEGSFLIETDETESDLSEQETEQEVTLAVPGDDIASGSYKDITWVIDADGKLTVTGTGDFMEYKTGESLWYDYRESVISAEINVTGAEYASSMFSDHHNLISVDLSGFETGNITDMSFMFSGCKSLKNLNLKGFDTSNAEYMEGMFLWCNNLSSLDISTFDTRNVISMGSMFYDCSSLTTVDVSNFDTRNVTDMSEMFAYCNNLTSLNLSGFVADKIEYLSRMFYDCNNLTSLDLSGINTEKVDDMSGIFYDCSSLTSLNISGFKTGNTTNMKEMFSGCSSLASLDVSAFDTSNVTNMYAMFQDCSSLTSLDVSNFVTEKVTNMSWLFSGCAKLTNIDLRNFITRNVTDISGMFGGCASLTNLDVGGFETKNVTSMHRVFSGCSNLANVDVSGFNTVNVSNMSYLFSECGNLANIEVSNFNTGKVTSMRGMFQDCNSLDRVDVNGFDTEKVTDMSYMFCACRGLTSLDMSSFDAENVIACENLCTACTNLTTIDTPCNLKKSVSLPNNNTEDAWYQPDGTIITELPQNLNHSIRITKNTKHTDSGENIANGSYKDITWSIDAEGKLTVTGTGDFSDSANSDRAPWYAYRDTIQSAQINVTSMINASYMFYCCGSLTSLDMSGFDMDNVKKADFILSGCDRLNSVYAPRNCHIDGLELPDSQGVWHDLNGNEYGNLPMDREETILLINKDYTGQPVEKITAYKTQTIYHCGDIINTDDIIVMYYAKDGTVKKVSNFTTNISDIDMTTLGKKTLIITYIPETGNETTALTASVTITVSESAKYYSVTFNLSGKGSDIINTGVKEGSLLERPQDPQAKGYTFTGWYKDQDCKFLWDFETDTVTSDITLYAGWKENNNEPDNPDNPSIDGVLPEDIPADGKIPDGLWIAGIQTYTYTGKPIKPEVRVYDSNKLLKAGQDYTIKYKNNTKANDALNESTAPAVVVKGKGNYTGTEKQTFEILPVDLNDASITADDITVAYNKKVQKKVPVVTFNGKKLAKNKDFTVSYPSQETDAYKSAGTYEILLTAKQGGNFTGTRTVQFTITNNTLISGATVEKIADQTYTGKAIEPELGVIMKKTPLVKNTDYTVKYVNNIESGTATAILTGIGKYAGTKKVTFKIKGTPLKGAAVSGITDKVYNGAAQEQNITVTLNNQTLTAGTDYKVVYSKNVNAGTASVTISGINAYSGTIKKAFRIKAYDIKGDTGNLLEGPEKEITAKYMKGGSRPKLELTFAGRKLVEGKDYTVSYKNNKTVTTDAVNVNKKPSISIKGRGNFKGNLTKTFTITAKSLSDGESPVTLTVADKGFVNKAGKYVSVPILTDADGKKLAAGKDYEKTIVYTLEDGTELTKNSWVSVGTKIKVSVTGKGAYSGQLEGVYEIKQNDFSKAKISIKSQTYTGKAVTLNEDSVTVRIGKETLSLGTDYEIVENSYINNVKKGTASVTIIGKGNYGGAKTVKFKITARKLSWFWRLFG